jgi:hypothetical protein
VAEVGTSKNHGGGQGKHNKPIGCGASGTYAPGLENEEEGIRAKYIMSHQYRLG